MKPIVITAHAQEVLLQRQIQGDWLVETVRNPDWTELDPAQQGGERRFRSIIDNGGRVLRVVIVETADEIRILTAFFDRRAKRPP